MDPMDNITAKVLARQDTGVTEAATAYMLVKLL